MGISPFFHSVFRTPSTRTSSAREEPSIANSCWLWRVGGDGDAGSLLPGVLSPEPDVCVH